MRNLPFYCEFGEELATVMHDIFIIGFGKGPIMDRLCEEKAAKLSFQRVVELATNKEASFHFFTAEMKLTYAS